MGKIKDFLLRHWVLMIALLVFLAPIIITEYNVLQATHGVFSYPFDDAFIHMAIAKNLAFHGVWGISPHEFSSASSSVLYPLLLAGAFKIFGAHIIFPFVINMVAGIGFLIVLYRWLRRQDIQPVVQLIILLCTIILTPLPVIALFGMEHTMHILFCFLFIYRFSASVEKSGDLPWAVYLYGFLVVATRYESAFLVAMACLLLLTRRRWLVGVQLGFISGLPILVFGLIALYKGSYFIPNSVLIKSVTPPLTVDGLWDFFTSGIFNRLYFAHPSIGGVAIQRLLLLLPLTYWLFRTPLLKAPAYRYILLLLTAAVLLHLLFANTGVLFRYEAYLVGCSVPILGVLIVKYSRELVAASPLMTRLVLFSLLLALCFPLLLRSRSAFEIPQQGSINIYDMQYQMGRFVQRYYNNTPVAIGDIGAVSYYTTGKNLDLEGLGNLDVARSRKMHYWTPDFLAWLAHKDSIQLAIVFDRSYPAQLLHRWTKVATWQIPHNVACYSDVVSFYAVDSAAAPALRKNLNGFSRELPADVMARYY